MEYEVFASFYDSLMSNANYEKRAKYVLSLFNKFGKTPTLLLDLACGTGSFSEQFLSENIDVIGVDSSAEMLNIARRKLPGTLLLQQFAEELDLYGTVDGAVCLMDSLNHITNYDNFKKAVKNVALFLEKDCLFIFDVNTQFKHKEILGDNSFISETNNVFCAWQNETDENYITNIYLDFFVNNSGSYKRYSESFLERGYSKEQIAAALSAASLKIEAVYDDLTQNAPKFDSERVFYVTRKI